MAPGTMIQGGRFAGAGVMEVRRSAQVEMEGGQRLSGKIDLRPVIVDGDVGQYLIAPHKIKMIRFLKPVEEVNPVNGPEGNNNVEGGGGEEVVVVRQAPQARAAVLAQVAAAEAAGGFAAEAATRGKVITTRTRRSSGRFTFRRASGLSSTSARWPSRLTSCGRLPSPTIVGRTNRSRPERRRPAARTTPAAPAPGGEASLPRYSGTAASSSSSRPWGTGLRFTTSRHEKSESLELSGSKEAPLEVVPDPRPEPRGARC